MGLKLWHLLRSHMWKLIIHGPGYFGTAYELPLGLTQIGRADENDIVLSGDLVSRKHCRLSRKGENVVLEDLGSRNGTQVNGATIKGSAHLKADDVVTVGENSLALRRLRTVEVQDSELVDPGGGGKVKRFGQGAGLPGASMLVRDVSKAGWNDISAEHPGAGMGRPDTQSLALLYRAIASLSHASSLQVFLDEACDLVMKRVRATTGVVLIKHPLGVMVPAAVRHTQKLAPGEVPVSDAIIEAALAKGSAIAVDDVQQDSRFSDRDSVVLYGIDQVLCIPIGGQAPFAGVLYLNRARPEAEPAETLLDICTAVAQLVALGVQKFEPASTGTKADRLKFELERLYSPEAASRLAAELHAGGKLNRVQELTATVVHLELCGLPTAASRLPPALLLDTIAEWQRLTSRLLQSFEGALDFIAADAARAVFGMPYPRNDDPIRAVRAARALKAEWERFSARQPVESRLRMRAGITTGRLWAGAVGSEARIDSVVVGEVAHLARLLCASAEPGQVLLTGKSLAQVGARFDVAPLGERALQQVKQAVFEVLDEDFEVPTLTGKP